MSLWTQWKTMFKRSHRHLYLTKWLSCWLNIDFKSLTTHHPQVPICLHLYTNLNSMPKCTESLESFRSETIHHLEPLVVFFLSISHLPVRGRGYLAGEVGRALHIGRMLCCTDQHRLLLMQFQMLKIQRWAGIQGTKFDKNGSKVSILSFVGGWGWIGWHCSVRGGRLEEERRMKSKWASPFRVYSGISPRKWHYLRGRRKRSRSHESSI